MGQPISVRWRIESVDPQVALILQGQRLPDEGVTRSKPPSLSSASSAGSASPSVQWGAGGQETLVMRSSLVAAHALDDIRPQRDVLDRLVRQDPILGRAPRVRLVWGDETIVGFVSRLQTRVTGYWVTGYPKSVAFELEIVEAPDVRIDVGATAPQGETQHLVLADGELLESLAARALGSAVKGDLVRRINPQIAGAGEAAGARVRVFEADHPAMRLPLFPTGVPFLDPTRAGNTWAPVVAEVAADRAETGGLSWDQLPEAAEIT